MKYSKHDELMYLFNEYLEYGGFPEVVLSKDKKEILSSYFLTIFLGIWSRNFRSERSKNLRYFLDLHSGILVHSWFKKYN
ncbi:hypothetical protein NLC36_05590 [Candidatus Aminicenantes bacterium AC-335-L06]|nr:hypothetical protein [Candidatus Aminicenantes bacterium AC-335-L06]